MGSRVPNSVEVTGRGSDRAGAAARRSPPGPVGVRGLLAVIFCVLATTALAADRTPVRVGVLKFGTVNWELDVVRTHGLARAEGVDIEVVPLASKSATHVALQGGAVDVIVSDWVWVSRQRAEGAGYTFVPYSVALGALVVHPAAGVEDLADLAGKRLGVAGGPVDKSWLLLRAYSKQVTGRDLKAMVEPNFVAPPLLNELMLGGDLPAVLNFWHYAARLEAAGMRRLLGVQDILRGLGVSQPVPMIGWVFDEAWAEANRDAIAGFLRASSAAKRMLLEQDAEWNRIRPLTKAPDEATLSALRDAYRAGVPRRFGEAERTAAAQVFQLMAREGGRDLVGRSRELSPGTFWAGYTIGQ